MRKITIQRPPDSADSHARPSRHAGRAWAASMASVARCFKWGRGKSARGCLADGSARGIRSGKSAFEENVRRRADQGRDPPGGRCGKAPRLSRRGEIAVNMAERRSSVPGWPGRRFSSAGTAISIIQSQKSRLGWHPRKIKNHRKPLRVSLNRQLQDSTLRSAA